MKSKETSFTSANSLPMKTISYLTDMKEGINPIHLQVCPTNKCNLNCSFCSCNDREKKQELSELDLMSINLMAFNLGIKAYTITGGGEPLLHPRINEFIENADSYDIKLGLVTNGMKLKNLKLETINKLTWCRISFDDSREFNGYVKEQLTYVKKFGKDVDWAFSYVVTKDKHNIENMLNIIKWANANEFTHVRFVPDLYNTEDIDMTKLKERLSKKVDVSKCIFQDRQDYTKGNNKCAISLLKPMIAPDGYIYPCCGVQYALEDTTKHRMFPEEMRMGHYTDLTSIVLNQKMFNGSVCNKCYYENYNIILNALEEDYEHKEFV